MASSAHNSTATEHLFADYWAEYQDIEKTKPRPDEEDDQSKTPDEGEQELAWLKEAGYGQVASTFEDGKDFSETELETLMSTLTLNQAAVVKRRVDTISATLRKRHKHAKTDVRDVFANTQGETTSTSPEHVRRAESMYVLGRPHRKGSAKGRESSFLKRGGYDMTGMSEIPQENTNTGIATLSIQPKSTISRTGSTTVSGPVNPMFTIIDQEVSCQFVEVENSQNGSVLTKDHLPNFKLAKDHLGVTRIGDLSRADLLRIRSFAHIELTVVLETNGIFYTRRKPKVKSKDHGIFGVSLQTLLEFDRKRDPGAKIPLVFKQVIAHLDKTGLESEGILRVPGSAGRVKQLRQDIEERFYQPEFSWDDVWPNDAAAILKQLLRELPAPLLTHEHLEAFAQVESIPEAKEQLRALNLLVLVLPEAHRNTLLALLQFLRRVIDHIDDNRMSLTNVAMIMAPNLFMVNTKSKNVREIEVNMAAGTSNIVTMLVKYQPLLWTVPPILIMQIRRQAEAEQAKKSSDKSIMKFLGKRDKPELNRKSAATHDADFQDGVIRVQAPNLTKSCAAVQLDGATTAGDIVAKFRRHDDHSPTWLGEGSSPNSKKGHHHGRKHVFTNPDNATFAEDNTYLYEIGGNIGERCLDHNTAMLLLYRINPNAEWVIKTRPNPLP